MDGGGTPWTETEYLGLSLTREGDDSRGDHHEDQEGQGDLHNRTSPPIRESKSSVISSALRKNLKGDSATRRAGRAGRGAALGWLR